MKGCRNSENALSPALPHGGGSRLQRIWRFWRFERQLGFTTVDAGRLKSKKAANTTCFLAEPLIPTATPSSLPWERVRERATSRKACIGAVKVLGKIAAIRRMPSPQPFPTGEGADCSRFCGCRRFEKQLGFTTVDAGRLKNKKQHAQPVFLAEPLIPTAAPSSLPWERARERVASRKACMGG